MLLESGYSGQPSCNKLIPAQIIDQVLEDALVPAIPLCGLVRHRPAHTILKKQSIHILKTNQNENIKHKRPVINTQRFHENVMFLCT